MSKKSSIKELVYKNPANNKAVIDCIEDSLIDLRGYVFRMPKPGTPVIALLSGGLDTTSVVSILLEKYKLSVYALYIERNLPHSKNVRNAVAFFDNYFEKNYPNLYHRSFTMGAQIPPNEVKNTILSAENSEVVIGTRKGKEGIPLQPSLYASLAMYYSKYLKYGFGKEVKTIFGAWLPTNSIWFGYESLSAMRSIMLHLCCMDSNYDWQFTSLPMEPELGLWLGKEDLISRANAYGLPLEKTWTCFMAGAKQCGGCPNCYSRKEAFKKSLVVDKTEYGVGFADNIRNSFCI